jgi:hypothetical protein
MLIKSPHSPLILHVAATDTNRLSVAARADTKHTTRCAGQESRKSKRRNLALCLVEAYARSLCLENRGKGPIFNFSVYRVSNFDDS